uniref:Cytochrome P450 n=1 Tax=Phenylobacterium glaciei TaxID=2803784 RepID=A0A974S701_9CAUL|nr:cytochrome P450 [Phenylobacterium glaciei]
MGGRGGPRRLGRRRDPEEILARLPYLKMVWEETLRLYPPALRIDREAMADDDLCGHAIRKGDQISIWPWIVHRHRLLWDEPDVFNPENFDPEAKAAHHRFQYIPFGAGPRVCIGRPSPRPRACWCSPTGWPASASAPSPATRWSPPATSPSGLRAACPWSWSGCSATSNVIPAVAKRRAGTRALGPGSRLAYRRPG